MKNRQIGLNSKEKILKTHTLNESAKQYVRALAMKMFTGILPIGLSLLIHGYPSFLDSLLCKNNGIGGNHV